MSTVVDTVDPAQISISERAHGVLERLKEAGHFSEMRDIYRFGIAYALAQNVRPKRADGPRRNLYSISTLDPDGALRFAIEHLYPLEGESAYRIAERLADWGVVEIGAAFEERFQTIADLLPDV